MQFSEVGRDSMTSLMYTGELRCKMCKALRADVARLGRLHLNAGGLCPIRTRATIQFWQIDELLLGESSHSRSWPLFVKENRLYSIL